MHQVVSGVFQGVSGTCKGRFGRFLRRFRGSEGLRCITWGARGFNGVAGRTSGSFGAFSVGYSGVMKVF